MACERSKLPFQPQYNILMVSVFCAVALRGMFITDTEGVPVVIVVVSHTGSTPVVTVSTSARCCSLSLMGCSSGFIWSDAVGAQK